MWIVEFYETANGRTPIIDFIESLPVKSQAKCLKYIEILTERGLSLPANYVKHRGCLMGTEAAIRRS